MKTLLTLIILFSACFTGFSQLSDAQLKRLEYQVDSAASILHEKLITKSESLLSTQFTVDTFKVETLLAKKMRVDTSQAEHITAINEAEIQYTFLMDKYYSLLMNIYDEEGKKSIALAQKKWLKYRDDEIKMTERLYDEEKKGNLISKEIAKATENLELTKERVVELYKHISGGGTSVK